MSERDPRIGQAEQIQDLLWVVSMPLALFHWAVRTALSSIVPEALLAVGMLAAHIALGFASIDGWLSGLLMVPIMVFVSLLTIAGLVGSDSDSEQDLSPGHRLVVALIMFVLVALLYWCVASVLVWVLAPVGGFPFGRASGWAGFLAFTWAYRSRGPRGGKRVRPWERDRSKAGAFGVINA